jgi:DNA-binding CsgD family transcriptional regulator
MGLLLVGGGISLLALNFILGQTITITLPLAIIVLGMAFFVLVSIFIENWRWAATFYIPGSILVALGLILLLNSVTGDYQSWAYAWLLIVAGIGLGVVLSGDILGWGQLVKLIGAGMIGLGIIFFALFGAIAGGPFIQVMAAILLALGGLALFWLKPETLLTAPVFRRLRRTDVLSASPQPDQSVLVEPLSSRELEVLSLIDQGLSNPEIAARLTVATSTVKTHINNIYGKLSVETRVQAINRAHELGLL